MRRKKHREDDGGINLGIIVTPMLDMSFQILAFFIMTYNPSALEGHIDGTLLPPTLVATKGPKTEMELPPVDTEPELTDVLMVVVKAVGKGKTEGKRGDGEPSRILVKLPESATAETVSDTDLTLDEGLKKLGTELKKYGSDPASAKTNIKIEADGDLKHQYTMMVYDVCKKAGFKNVSFVAPAFQRGGGD